MNKPTAFMLCLSIVLCASGLYNLFLTSLGITVFVFIITFTRWTPETTLEHTYTIKDVESNGGYMIHRKGEFWYAIIPPKHYVHYYNWSKKKSSNKRVKGETMAELQEKMDSEKEKLLSIVSEEDVGFVKY